MSNYFMVVISLLLFITSYLKTTNDVNKVNKAMISFISTSIYSCLIYLFYFMFNDNDLVIITLMVSVVISTGLIIGLLKRNNDPKLIIKKIITNVFYGVMITVSITESFIYVVDRYHAILIYFQIPLIIVISCALYFIQKLIMNIPAKNTDYMIKYLIGICIGLTIIGYKDINREIVVTDRVSVVNADNRIDYYDGVDLNEMFDDVSYSNATLYYQPTYFYSNTRALSVIFIVLAVSFVKVEKERNKKHT